ncbi:MAG: ATP-binding protein [Casimicrobiaceae bacterium]
MARRERQLKPDGSVAVPDASPSQLELLARIADALERLSPAPMPLPDFRHCLAAQWRRVGQTAWLEPVSTPHWVDADDLVAVDAQRELIDRNTRQFVRGRPANNVLLTGARGTGKSSLVKAMLARYGSQGLRLIEVDKAHLGDMATIARWVSDRPERFIVFCDDLSFDAGDASYKALKAALDGSIAAATPNLLIYATSNRRHLLPEYFHENAETRYVGEEVHFGESVEEKISLSERFGLWISFHPFDQDAYLAAARRWVERLGGAVPTARQAAVFEREALQWALQRGSRSGRVAHQFARDWCGRHPHSRARV